MKNIDLVKALLVLLIFQYSGAILYAQDASKYALEDAIVKQHYPDSVINRDGLSNIKAYRVKVDGELKKVYSFVKFDISNLKGFQIADANVSYRGTVTSGAEDFADDFNIDLHSVKSGFDPAAVTWSNKPGLDKKLGTSILGSSSARSSFNLDGNKLDEYFNEALRKGDTTITFAFVSSGKDSTDNMWIGGAKDGSYGPILDYSVVPESSKYGVADAIVKQQYPDSVIDRDGLSNLKAYREKVADELKKVYSFVKFDISHLTGQQVEDANISYRGTITTGAEDFADDFNIDLHSLKGEFDPDAVTWSNKPGLDKKLGTSVLGSSSARTAFNLDGNKIDEYINEAIRKGQSTVSFAFVSSGKDSTDLMWIGGIGDGSYGPIINYSITPESSGYGLADAIVKQQYADSVIDRTSLSNLKAYRERVGEELMKVYSFVKFDISHLMGQQVKDANISYRGTTTTGAEDFADEFNINLHSLKGNFDPETVTWGNKPGLDQKLGTSVLGSSSARTTFNLDGNKINDYVNEAIRSGKSSISFAFVSSGKDSTDLMWIGGVNDGSYGPIFNYTITPDASKYGLSDAIINEQYPDSVIDRTNLSNIKAYRKKVGDELKKVYSLVKFDISGLNGIPVEEASVSYRGTTTTGAEDYAEDFQINLHSLKDSFDPETITWSNKPGLDQKLGTSILGSSSARTEFDLDGNKLVDYINNALMQGKNSISFGFVSSGKDSIDLMWIGGVNDGSYGPILSFEQGNLYTPENDTLYVVADAYVSQVAGEEDTNFGDAADMHIIRDAENNASKQVLLKYDISQVSPENIVGNATLNISLAQHSDNPGDPMEEYMVEVLAVDDQSWAENQVTWNTKPETSTDVLMETNVTNKGSSEYYSLTSDQFVHYINDAVKAGKDSVSFLVRGKTNTPGSRLWSNGKEYKNESYLALDYSAAPPAQDLTVVADAYVSQAEPQTNYGGEADQHLINDDANELSKWNIFKYDLSNAYGEPISASLKIYGSIHDSNTLDNFTFEIFSADGTDWQEDQVTWENKPAVNDQVLLTGNLKQGGQWYTLSSPEFTEYVQQAIDNGNQYITLVAKGANETPEKRAWFSGKEWRASSLILNYEPEVAFPQFSPQPGHFIGNVTVNVSTSTAGATLYFTLDGSEPTEASNLYVPEDGIVLNDTTEIKVVAYADGLNPSPVASGIYQITPSSTPSFSPDPAIEYQDNVTVSLTAEPATANIFYSTDGSDPAQQYDPNAGINLNSTTTIKAKSITEDGTYESPVVEATYTIINTVPGPGTGPGGVGFADNTRSGQPVNSLWLKADAIEGVEDGAAVTVWEDHSGNDNNAINTFADDGSINIPNTNANQEEAPIFVADTLNGMPVLTFGASTETGNPGGQPNMYIPDADNLDGGPGLSVFLIYKRNEMIADFASIIQKRDIRGSDPEKQAWILEQNGGSQPHEVQLVLSRDLFLRNGDELTTDNYYLINSDYSSSEGLAKIYQNGVQKNALPYSKTVKATDASVIIGGFQPMNLAEVIYYNQGLNAAQRTIVNNYLATKYGMEIYDGEGNVVNLYDNQDYKMGLIGIGMADADNKHSNASGSGLLLQEDGSSLAAGEYLFAGHNGNEVTNADTWERTWYVKPAGGDIDAVIGFDFAAVGLETPADASGYSLYYDDGGENGFVALEAAPVLEGSTVTFQVSAVGEGIYGMGKTAPGTGGCATIEKPTVSIDGQDGNSDFVLTSSADEGNQWMLDGEAIEGATAKTYSPEATGSFAVGVIIGGCDPVLSDPVVVTGLDDLNRSAFSLYPNPTKGLVEVEFKAQHAISTAQLAVYDLAGLKLQDKTIRNSNGVFRSNIDLSALEKGIYLVVLRADNVVYQRKIQKF